MYPSFTYRQLNMAFGSYNHKKLKKITLKSISYRIVKFNAKNITYQEGKVITFTRYLLYFKLVTMLSIIHPNSLNFYKYEEMDSQKLSNLSKARAGI